MSPPPAEQEWQRRRPRGGRAGNLFFLLLARSGRVGLALIPFFLFWVALYFVLAAPAARRASFELADRLGRGGSPARRLWFALRHFYGFGRLLVDKLAILNGNAALYRFDSPGREVLQAALAQGKGAVLLTAHVGNWEIMAQVLRGLGARVTLVMYDNAPPELKATLERMAAGRAFRVLTTDGSPQAAAGILAALAEGDAVGLMGDRLMAGRGVRAPFLGDEVELPLGPYLLAQAARAPLLHVFALRTGRRRYAFFAHDPGPIAYTDRRHKEPDHARWARDFAAQLERVVREHPFQWGNLYSVWQAAAPGAPEPS